MRKFILEAFICPCILGIWGIFLTFCGTFSFFLLLNSHNRFKKDLKNVWIFIDLYVCVQRLLSNEEEKNKAIIQEVCFMVIIQNINTTSLLHYHSIITRPFFHGWLSKDIAGISHICRAAFLCHKFVGEKK